MMNAKKTDLLARINLALDELVAHAEKHKGEHHLRSDAYAAWSHEHKFLSEAVPILKRAIKTLAESEQAPTTAPTMEVFVMDASSPFPQSHGRLDPADIAKLLSDLFGE